MHTSGLEWSEAIEVHPLVLEADGLAATRQFGGTGHIAHLSQHHAGGDGHRRILRSGGLHVQGHVVTAGGFGQHPGQLAATDDADRLADGRWITLSRPARRAHAPEGSITQCRICEPHCPGPVPRLTRD